MSNGRLTNSARSEIISAVLDDTFAERTKRIQALREKNGLRIYERMTKSFADELAKIPSWFFTQGSTFYAPIQNPENGKVETYAIELPTSKRLWHTSMYGRHNTQNLPVVTGMLAQRQIMLTKKTRRADRGRICAESQAARIAGFNQLHQEAD